MTTFLIIICVVAFLFWLGRLLRRREQAKFRDVDAKMLHELRRDNPSDTGSDVTQFAQTETGPSTSSSTSTTSTLTEMVRPTLKAAVLDGQIADTLGNLDSVLNAEYRVLTHVPFSDVITTSESSRLSFLVCSASFAPVVAIDYSNRLSQTALSVLAEAGLPLLQIHSDETALHLKSRLRTLNIDLVALEGEEKRCPKCRGAMNLRAPKAGKNAGKRYWLCQTYPKCRGLIPA